MLITSGVLRSAISEALETIRGGGGGGGGAVEVFPFLGRSLWWMLQMLGNCDRYAFPHAAYMNLNSKRPEPALTPLMHKLTS